MKIMTYQFEGRTHSGILTRDERSVVSFTELGVPAEDLTALLQLDSVDAWIQQMAQKRSEDFCGCSMTPLSEVSLLAPIPHPAQDVICLGINYMAHAVESYRFKKEAFNGERPHAVYFSKRVNESQASGQPIPAHADICDSLDYEAELAVILSKDACNVEEKDAYNYILGYTILNDVSARTIQNRHKQWYFGKSLDGFCPTGPVVVTKDTLPYPPELNIRSRINGELRQDSNTRLLIFNIDHVIHELSQGMTLKKGTIISMGTPAGVGMGFEPPKYMKAGDLCECEIEGIGVLTNPISD